MFNPYRNISDWLRYQRTHKHLPRMMIMRRSVMRETDRRDDSAKQLLIPARHVIPNDSPNSNDFSKFHFVFVWSIVDWMQRHTLMQTISQLPMKPNWWGGGRRRRLKKWDFDWEVMSHQGSKASREQKSFWKRFFCSGAADNLWVTSWLASLSAGWSKSQDNFYGHPQDLKNSQP